MSESFRSLIVILAIATVIFYIARINTALKFDNNKNFKRRIITWYLLILTAFFAQNFWLFSIVCSFILYINGKKDSNPVAFVFFNIFTLPLFSSPIPGFGFANYLFDLNYFRIISLTILLPLFLRGFNNNNKYMPFGSTGTDKFILGFIFYTIVLVLVRGTFTNAIRQAFLYFIDIFLPYYVISRYLKKEEDFDDAVKSFVIAACIVGTIGVFELLKGWLLYHSMSGGLGISWDGGGYLLREGSVRAIASSGQAIVLGYIIAVAIGFNAYLYQRTASIRDKMLVSIILFAGVVAPLSRGPWVQVALTYLILIILAPNSLVNLAKLTVVGIVVLLSVQISPYGAKIVEYLPFMGQVDAGNIEFRKNLLDNALIVVQENLWFGSADYMQAEELEQMRSGGDGGIIDIVNSYIAITLSGGFVGLFLFVGYFASVGKSLFDSYSFSKKFIANRLPLVKAMIALFAGIVVVIYTVSSIYFIPIIYWSIGAMAIALRKSLHDQSVKSMQNNKT